MSPALGSTAMRSTYSTEQIVELSGLQPNTRYYFALESADPAGNTVTDDNGGALYAFATGYGAVTFADDMEDGPGGWTHSGDFDQWEWGVPTYLGGPSSAHSPDNCWGTDLDDYFMHDDFFSGYWIEEQLRSPAIPIGETATLTFWHWYDLVEGSDEMTVEISANGGPWQNVTPGGYYDGANYGWQKETIDLSAFANSTIRVRFDIWADTWFDFLDPHAGWYVDDVEVATLHSFGYGAARRRHCHRRRRERRPRHRGSRHRERLERLRACGRNARADRDGREHGHLYRRDFAGGQRCRRRRGSRRGRR